MTLSTGISKMRFFTLNYPLFLENQTFNLKKNYTKILKLVILLK